MSLRLVEDLVHGCLNLLVRLQLATSDSVSQRVELTQSILDERAPHVGIALQLLRAAVPDDAVTLVRARSSSERRSVGSSTAGVPPTRTLATGTRREGAFMGIWSFVDNAAVGIAVFIGMQGLEAIGYVPNVDQTPQVIEGIKFLYCVLPALCHGAALLGFLRFPITREVHAEIRRQLEERARSPESAQAAESSAEP